MGPSVFNFSEAAALAIQAGAAFAVRSMSEAVDIAAKLSRDANTQCIASRASLQFASSHQGAAEKTAAAVVKLLS
jgi:3-deoxy-D-manno-octulosonic-acid transferase